MLEPIYGERGNRRLRIIQPGDTTTVRARAKDPDGDVVRFRWVPDATAGSISSTTDSVITWVVGSSGMLRVIAYDGRGGEARSHLGISQEPGVVFSGQVRDPLGRPIDSAEVDVNGETTRTDDEGRFRILVSDWDAVRFVLTIRKPGFGFVSRVVENGVTDGWWTLSPGTTVSVDPSLPIAVQDQTSAQECQGPLSSQIDWSQYPRQRVAQIFDANGNVVEGSFPADLQAALQILGAGTPCNPGVAVSIPPNALVDEQGNAPPGNVDVFISTVDVFAPDAMPGDYTVLFGDSLVYMQTYGAGIIEVRDATRQYQLRTGVDAMVTIPIDSTQIRLSQDRRGELAPTIPLLWYNELSGNWSSHADATLDPERHVYTGQVSHLSAFNTDLIKTDQSCVRIDAQAIPHPFKLEVTIPMPDAAPVVRTYDLGADASQPNQMLHAVYNLPQQTWIAMVPIQVGSGGELVPLGTFVVNTGPAQVPTDPNRPAYDFFACQSQVTLFEVAPTIDVMVDGTGRRFGPLPTVLYALADESLGDQDFYPLGPNSGGYFLYGLFDTGSTRVNLFNQIPYFFVVFPNGDPDQGLTCNAPNRLTDANWWDSDASHLGVGTDVTAQVWMSGLQSQLDGRSIFTDPDVAITSVSVRPQPTVNVTLLGAPVTQQAVALIDYRSEVRVDGLNNYPNLDDPANTGIVGFTITDFVVGPDITFFGANDPAIPFPELFLRLERFGTPASRWIMDRARFEHGGATVDSEDPSVTPGNFFLFDTGTNITAIDSDVASTLGLLAGTGQFSCLGGTNNGFAIDAFVVDGDAGSYTVQNASVCWDTNLDSSIFEAIIGMNFFDQVAVLWDGPRDRVGLTLPTTTPVTWTVVPARVCN